MRAAETLNAEPTMMHVMPWLFLLFWSVAIEKNRRARRDHMRIHHALPGHGVRWDDIVRLMCWSVVQDFACLAMHAYVVMVPWLEKGMQTAQWIKPRKGCESAKQLYFNPYKLDTRINWLYLAAWCGAVVLYVLHGRGDWQRQGAWGLSHFWSLVGLSIVVGGKALGLINCYLLVVIGY